MADYTPEKMQEFVKNLGQASSEAWTTQSEFYQESLKRNVSCFSSLAKARMSSFKAMGEAKTFTQAFEANLAFEEKVREDLSSLQEENTAAWTALQTKLKNVYTFKDAQEVAAEKPKAKKAAKKPAAKKAEPKKAEAKADTKAA